MPRIKNKIQRQMERYLHVEDIGPFVDKVKSRFLDDEKASETIGFLDGLDALLAAVEETYAQYEDKAKMALRNLEISSRELNEVNTKLESLNQSIKAMLESLGPGLLFFDRNGICAPIFSKSCLTILGVDPGNKDIVDVLEVNPTLAADFRDLLHFAFDNNSAMSFDDIFRFPPETFERLDARHIHVDFKPINHSNGKIGAVLVIVTDKAHEREAKIQLEKKEKYAEKLIRIVQKKNFYFQLITDIEHYFLTSGPGTFEAERNLSKLKSELHTFKGLSGSFYIDDLTHLLQEIETIVHHMTPDDLIPSTDLARWREQITHAIANEKKCAEEVFGGTGDAHTNAAAINLATLDRLRSIITRHKDYIPSELLMFLHEHFLTQSIFDVLGIFDFYVRETAHRLGKNVNPVVISGDDVHISPVEYEGFFKALIHMARNVVDHGIEDEQTRQAHGKDPVGNVTLTVTSYLQGHKKWFRLLIGDDGRGIDPNVIAAKIGDPTLVASMTPHQILQKIFDEGFSSRDIVTNISGRGVGLGAVKKEVTDLGGTITVESVKGVGTTFTIDLPVL